MMSKIKKVFNVVGYIVLILFFVFAVLLVGIRLIGLQPFVVLSGSMEPNYRTGSIIYVNSSKPEDIHAGDAITFVMNENLEVVTHRVVKIDAQKKYFYTKGDANEVADGSPVSFQNVIGKPVFTIPYLGYLSYYISRPPGSYILIGFILCLVISVIGIALYKQISQYKQIPKEAEK